MYLVIRELYEYFPKHTFTIPLIKEKRCKRVIIIRIEKKQGSLYTKGTLNLAFYLQFS